MNKYIWLKYNSRKKLESSLTRNLSYFHNFLSHFFRSCGVCLSWKRLRYLNEKLRTYKKFEKEILPKGNTSVQKLLRNNFAIVSFIQVQCIIVSLPLSSLQSWETEWKREGVRIILKITDSHRVSSLVYCVWDHFKECVRRIARSAIQSEEWEGAIRGTPPLI